ncbi:hypothetical protein BJV82DRAFT_669995 [Fennellomyces sp. T-0311]|nr:hypothetical protein BJV82DRAFT_669995 [Fennellomyces sp. T-0311]
MSAHTNLTSPGSSPKGNEHMLHAGNSPLAMLGAAAAAKQHQQQQQQPTDDWANDLPSVSFNSSQVGLTQSPVPNELERFIVEFNGRAAELEKRMFEQEKAARAQADTIVQQNEKLDRMADLIKENQVLRSTLEHTELALQDAMDRIAELEKGAQQVATPVGGTTVAAVPEGGMEVDTREDSMGSRHAPTEAEWERGRPKREKQQAAANKQRQQRQQQQQQQQQQMERLFDQIEQQPPLQQQQQ